MTARFLSVAKGNISRLRDAQAFHAAVKRPPYFMFARQRRHFIAGHSLPGLYSSRLRDFPQRQCNEIYACTLRPAMTADGIAPARAARIDQRSARRVRR